ncbi:hypothetical protein BT96DRAFT_107717 [Gymnopus androsaceus JB14]|uniref:Uncharacterized protein n=1 Tax=Gymnopus androsaceus JB14 TaxID=1447944 RepID=A0A6A4I6G9_9AGAR|nr:hypothetical protein BT96DRAFT_107717 [Gymnopus androsaceus JB14]
MIFSAWTRGLIRTSRPRPRGVLLTIIMAFNYQACPSFLSTCTVFSFYRDYLRRRPNSASRQRVSWTRT